MIREKRTVNCWLLTKSKRKKRKEKRGGRRKEEKKKKKEKKRGGENEESMKRNKGNCEGKPTKTPAIAFYITYWINNCLF